MTRTLEILDQLVAFPTVSRDSNLALIDWVHTLLTDAGFEVTRLPTPDGAKAGLFARIGPKVTGGICLSAHSDVVPVEGQDWHSPPFTLTDHGTHVTGRGTTDMKGFLASALALADRVKDTPLGAPLTLCLSYDEEIGCVGIQQMMPQLAPLLGQPRAVIVGEPTSMQVATGHKGKTALKVQCHGQAGHSALAPDFVNAIHVAAEFVQGLRALQTTLANGPRDAGYSIPYTTLHIGRIAGGQALNIVPDAAVLDMEFRHLAESPAQDIHAQISALAARVSNRFPTVAPISLKVVNTYPGLHVDPDADIVGWAYQMAGTSTSIKVPFGTEAGFFANLGLDTVVIGPGDMATDGHKPNESVSKSQLAACDAMMDRLLATLKA